MPELSPEQRERNARWANIARRTHALHATEHIRTAINAAILTDPLDAAEAALNQLDDEPNPHKNAARVASDRAAALSEPDPTEAP